MFKLFFETKNSLLNKKLFRVDKEEKTILPVVGISFQSKVILPQEVLINYSSR